MNKEKVFIVVITALMACTSKGPFGGWSIDKELFLYIRTILPAGKIILELGSGWTSGEFSKNYTVYSVEHNRNWIGKYNTNYIYAPINNGWYDYETLQRELPSSYDLIIVDGPPGDIGRAGFLINFHLFNNNVPIIFDDVNRTADYKLMQNVAALTNRNYIVMQGTTKQFGIIP